MLNAQQQHAVRTTRPKVVCIAGAGAGKTKVLVERFARLLEDGADANRLLAVTFTRDAAAEMSERLLARLPGRKLPEIRTFHSWGVRLIRRHSRAVGRSKDFGIYDGIDQVDLVATVAEELGLKAPRLRDVRKSEAISKEVGRRLRQANAITFDQIERQTLWLLQNHEPAQREWVGRYDHVAVDEYQDTNLAQVAIVAEVHPPNLFIVGDSRQAIYGFRGATDRSIKEAAESAAFEVVELVVNYRSVPDIVSAANAIAGANVSPMVAARDGDELNVAVHIRIGGDELQATARFLAWAHKKGHRWGQMAVLARTWRELERMRDQLLHRGIPHLYHGSRVDPWDSPDGRAVARLAHLASWSGSRTDDNYAGWVANWGRPGHLSIPKLRRNASRARRSVWEQLAHADPRWKAIQRHWIAEPNTVERVAIAHHLLREGGAWAQQPSIATMHCLTELEKRADDFLRWWSMRGVRDNRRMTDDDDRVQLLTCHASKGLEYNVVSVLGCHSRSFRSDQESKRLMYVAATRARDELCLTCPERVTLRNGSTAAATPTKYLEAIQWRNRQNSK